MRGSAGKPLPVVWESLDEVGTRFLRGQLALVAAGPGCIAGDAEIIVNRAGNGKRVRLDDLVSLFNGDEVPIRRNGKPTKGKRKWDTDIDTYVQCEIDGHMRTAKLKKAWYSGEKTTYTVTTDTGRTVRATDIHPFLTTEGWKKLGELEPGDVVHVRGKRSDKGRKPKNRYQTVKLANHPHHTGKKKLVSVHRLVVEADLNGMTLDEWLGVIRSGQDLSGYEFLSRDVHVHHKDENHLNNSLENLEILSPEEHLRLHGEQYVTNVLEKVAYETVVSIEEYGQEPTYDLELDTEPHNFTANGFVVHNTGKSAFVLNYALRSGVSCMYFSADSDASVQLARSLAILGGMNMRDAEELVLSEDMPRIEQTIGNVPVRFSYDPSPTLDTIERDLAAYNELYGDYPELVVVDNALDVVLDGDDDNQSQSLDSLMAWLHDMARETEACVIVLHHVTGPYNDANQPIPLSGVKGQIGRVPELILTLHKDTGGFAQEDDLKVSTVKNRGQRADPSGNSFVELTFDGYRMSITDKQHLPQVGDPWA